MTLRRLLNVAYAALAQNRNEEELAELDETLTGAGEKKRRPAAAPKNRNVSALLLAARMPQQSRDHVEGVFPTRGGG